MDLRHRPAELLGEHPPGGKAHAGGGEVRGEDAPVLLGPQRGADDGVQQLATRSGSGGAGTGPWTFHHRDDLVDELDSGIVSGWASSMLATTTSGDRSMSSRLQMQLVVERPDLDVDPLARLDRVDAEAQREGSRSERQEIRRTRRCQRRLIER